MKILIKSFTLVILFPLFSFSQVRWGIHLSPTLGWEQITKEAINNTLIERPGLGATVSFILQKPINQFIFLESGVGYALNASKFKFNVKPFPDYSKTMDGRIEVPLLLSIRQELEENFYVKYHVGSAVDFFGATGGFIFERKDSLSSLEIIIDSYGHNNFYLITGIGFEKMLKNEKNIYFGLSYHQGFRKIGYTTITYKINGQEFIYESLYTGNHLAIFCKYYLGKDIKRSKIPEKGKYRVL